MARPTTPRPRFPGGTTTVLVTVAGTLCAIACSDGTSSEPQPQPAVWAWTDDIHLGVTVRYTVPLFAPDCTTDSVFVSGPGLTGEVALRCTAARGVGFSLDELDFTPAPPPLPLIYAFRATIRGRTANPTAEVNCYQPLPAGIAPAAGDTVTSPFTLRWQPVPATGIDYSVYVRPTGSPPSAPAGVVRDGDSFTLTLASGSYNWSVTAQPPGLADGTSDRRCGSSWAGGPFTVR